MTKALDKYPHLKRAGRFFMSDDIYYTAPNMARAIMGQMLVFDAEHYTANDETGGKKGGVLFLAACEIFDEMDGNLIDAPLYSVTLTRSEREGWSCQEIGGGWYLCASKDVKGAA